MLPHNLRIANLEATRVFRSFLTGFLVALAYYTGVQIGFALTPPLHPISAFWPPNAILLASFLIVPRKRWWLLLLAVLPAHLLAQLPKGTPVATSLGWFLGNTGEALLGAYLITEVQTVRESFERVRGLLFFLLVGVLAAPLLTSFLDAGVVIGTGVGRDYWHVWTERLFSNTLAELTLVPTIVLFRIHGVEWFLRARWTKYFEAVLLALVVVAGALYAFAPGLSHAGRIYSFYTLLILLAWATLRFQFVGLSTTLLAVSLIASWAVVHNHAPFLASPQNVIPLQVFLFMVTLPSMFVAMALVQQSETADSLRASKARLVKGQEQERTRIARELHDGVGQLLSLVQIQLAQLEQASDLETRPKLEDLGRQVAEISQVTHEVSHGLHPSQLEYLGLSIALRKLCADVMKKEHAIVIDFLVANVPEHLSSNVSLSLYRIVQEALHNAAKYSRAQRIKVHLRVKSGRLWLEIDDDGIGFAKDKTSTGMGLISMQERIESIGGSLSIKSKPGRGTRVHASTPCVLNLELMESPERSQMQFDDLIDDSIQEDLKRDDGQREKHCG